MTETSEGFGLSSELQTCKDNEVDAYFTSVGRFFVLENCVLLPFTLPTK